MSVKPAGDAARHRKFRLGDRVRFQFGVDTMYGTIVEERGPLAAGRRLLYGVQMELEGIDDKYIEIPEDEMAIAE